MYACGPYTTQKSLSYLPLKELLKKAKEEQPHVLILSGPFVDMANEDVNNCHLIFKVDGSEDMQFATFEDLFQDLMRQVDRELQGVHVVIAPSHKEVHHFFPMPQPAFPSTLLPKNLRNKFTLTPNPSLLCLNELTVAFSSLDSLKELLQNMVVKSPQESGSKIDLALH